MEEEQKQKILLELENIVESKKTIDGLIGESIAKSILTLKPKSTLIHEDKGMLVDYQHEDGGWYRININKIYRE